MDYKEMWAELRGRIKERYRDNSSGIPMKQIIHEISALMIKIEIDTRELDELRKKMTPTTRDDLLR